MTVYYMYLLIFYSFVVGQLGSFAVGLIIWRFCIKYVINYYLEVQKMVFRVALENEKKRREVSWKPLQQ